MTKNSGRKKKFGGLLGKLFVFVVVLILFYAAYLFLIFKKMPSAMAEVSGVYNSIVASNMAANMDFAGAPPQTGQPAVKWTTINNRTSDEQLEAISERPRQNRVLAVKSAQAKVLTIRPNEPEPLTINQKEIERMETYEDFLDGNSMKVINALLALFNGKKDSAVLSAREETQMRAQIEAILKAYKPGEDMKEIEKETGKLE